jgi:hypothetical protein
MLWVTGDEPERYAHRNYPTKINGLERFKKNNSHPVEWQIKPVVLTFGFVSAQSQGFQTCSFAKGR